jgi:glutamate synthase domain-containing protein 2
LKIERYCSSGSLQQMTTMQRIFWAIAIASNTLALLLWTLGFGVWFFFLSIPITALGWYDLTLSSHSLNRLYPIAAYIRYAMEYIRPEIRQYFVASDTEERPFTREQRSLVYQRAKRARDTIPFGTQHELLESGYLSAMHSLHPKTVKEEHVRVQVGGADCTQPYNASRFNISAMSFGALSSNAILALNKGAKLGNFAHNTGEGGVSPYHEQGGGDLIWQMGTAYFGCRQPDGNFDEQEFAEKATQEQVKMIEIKLSQGAKPSHGGLLPAAKITAEIARIRDISMGQACHSPPTHSTFDSPIGLLQFVKKLRVLSGGKPVGFKLCVGKKMEFMAICKAMLETQITPDFITVDGAEGGTGAAPLEFSNRLGMSCLEGTYFVHNCLVGCGLRDSIKIICAGKTASGFELLQKLAVGADIVNAARTMMMALGCIQARSCNSNHCPTGIATQDKQRNKALNVQAKHLRVANYHQSTVEACMDLVGAIGLDNPDDLDASHLVRRMEDQTTKTYDQIHPPLAVNELLGKNINTHYARDWQKAQAIRFS